MRVAVAQTTSDPFAPTASQDPAAIDRIWQQGVSKYDAERGKLLQDVDKVNAAGPFRPDWESLQSYKVPDWYKDAKFGVFIHWGVYAVPAFGSEWYPRQMYIEGSEEYKHHIATYGTQEKFGYKDFIPMFKAEKFEPAAWQNSLGNPAPNTSFQCSSTTMVFKCMTAPSPIGPPPTWDLIVTSSVT